MFICDKGFTFGSGSHNKLHFIIIYFKGQFIPIYIIGSGNFGRNSSEYENIYL